MEQKPETAFDEYANRCLRPDKVKHLQKQFPRSNFKSSSEWAKAVINEINSVLLPAITFSVRGPPEEWCQMNCVDGRTMCCRSAAP